MNKKLLIIPGIALCLIAGVLAYTFLTTQTHINIVESQQLRYWNWETLSYEVLPLNTGVVYNFPVQNLGAGVEYTIEFTAANPNNRAIQYDIVTTSPNENVTLEFVCLQSGVEYFVVGQGTQNMVLNMRNAPAMTSSFGIKEIVNAGAPLTTNVQIVSTYDRLEVNNSIVWSICP